MGVLRAGYEADPCVHVRTYIGKTAHDSINQDSFYTCNFQPTYTINLCTGLYETWGLNNQEPFTTLIKNYKPEIYNCYHWKPGPIFLQDIPFRVDSTLSFVRLNNKTFDIFKVIYLVSMNFLFLL